MPSVNIARAEAGADAQFPRLFQRPIGTPQEFSREEDEIRFILPQYLARHRGHFNQADGARENSRAAANLPGERHLKTRLCRNFLGRVQDRAGRTVDQVDPQRCNFLHRVDRLVDVPSSLDPIRGRDANEKREHGRPDLAHRGHRFQQEPDAIVERTAVGIGARLFESGERNS